jgi:hypothetical protein
VVRALEAQAVPGRPGQGSTTHVVEEYILGIAPGGIQRGIYSVDDLPGAGLENRQRGPEFVAEGDQPATRLERQPVRCPGLHTASPFMIHPDQVWSRLLISHVLVHQYLADSEDSPQRRLRFRRGQIWNRWANARFQFIEAGSVQ